MSRHGPWVKQLERKVRQGFRGDPIGTIAFYGPDDKQATKVVVGISPGEGQPVSILKKWFAQDLDVRVDPRVGAGVVEFLRQQGARSLVMTRGIFGCPHEEGIDYPDGETCPECPYWAEHDRWEQV